MRKSSLCSVSLGLVWIACPSYFYDHYWNLMDSNKMELHENYLVDSIHELLSDQIFTRAPHKKYPVLFCFTHDSHAHEKNRLYYMTVFDRKNPIFLLYENVPKALFKLTSVRKEKIKRITPTTFKCLSMLSSKNLQECYIWHQKTVSCLANSFWLFVKASPCQKCAYEIWRSARKQLFCEKFWWIK